MARTTATSTARPPPRSNRNPVDNRASARRNARLATPLRPAAHLIRLVADPRPPPRRASARTPRRRRLATRQRRRRRVWDLESRTRGRPHQHMSRDGRSHAATSSARPPRPDTTVQFRAYKARVIASCGRLISSVASVPRDGIVSGADHRGPRPGRFAAQGQDLGRSPLCRQGPSSTSGSHISLSTSSSTIPVRGLMTIALGERHGGVVRRPTSRIGWTPGEQAWWLRPVGRNGSRRCHDPRASVTPQAAALRAWLFSRESSSVVSIGGVAPSTGEAGGRSGRERALPTRRGCFSKASMAGLWCSVVGRLSGARPLCVTVLSPGGPFLGRLGGYLVTVSLG